MQTKPSKFLSNEEGASPGGGAPIVPVTPPAVIAAPDSPKFLTEDKLEEKFQAFQNGFFANARKAGLLPKQDKPIETPAAPAQSAPDNPMAVLALRDAFDDATSELKLTKGQRSLLREHVMTRRPTTGDVESMVSDYVSRAGWLTPAPSIASPSAASTSAAIAAPTATPAPEAPKPPAMAPSAPTGHGLPTQGGITDLFSLTAEQRKGLGPAGVRKVLEQLADISNDQAGIPKRPKPPSQK